MATAAELEKGTTNLLAMLSNVCFRASKDLEIAGIRVIEVDISGRIHVETGEIRNLQVQTTKPLGDTISDVIDDPTTVDDTGSQGSERDITNGGEKISGGTTTFTPDS